jgi:hypothetical protein
MPNKFTTYASAVSSVPSDIEHLPSYKESQIANTIFCIDLMMELIRKQKVASSKLDA